MCQTAPYHPIQCQAIWKGLLTKIRCASVGCHGIVTSRLTENVDRQAEERLFYHIATDVHEEIIDGCDTFVDIVHESSHAQGEWWIVKCKSGCSYQQSTDLRRHASNVKARVAALRHILYHVISRQGPGYVNFASTLLKAYASGTPLLSVLASSMARFNDRPKFFQRSTSE
jgi:hypothetical protein